MAVLSALLLLAHLHRLRRRPAEPRESGEQPAEPNAAGSMAARAGRARSEADGRAAGRGAAVAAGAIAQRFPRRSDRRGRGGAEGGRPDALAVALVGDEGVRAVAGRRRGTPTGPPPPKPPAPPGRSLWLGRAARTTTRIYVAARAVEGAPAALLLIAASDSIRGSSAGRPARGVAGLAGGDPGRPGAGRARPVRRRTRRPTCARRCRSRPRTLQAKAPAGALPDGSAVEPAVRPVADGALLAVAAVPRGPAGAAARRRTSPATCSPCSRRWRSGLVLAVLLFVQMRKAETAQRAFAESEQRFRLAVEAARCGIWEWDLDEDRVLMSRHHRRDPRLGRRRRGAGRRGAARIAPEHRERVRQTLASARTYGAFDVSFRVPDRNGRSAWIDARGQARPSRAPAAYRRIVGVMLDVTEERITQARAQAAETRLRDAIDSVSEAFVLWDRTGSAA